MCVQWGLWGMWLRSMGSRRQQWRWWGMWSDVRSMRDPGCMRRIFPRGFAGGVLTAVCRGKGKRRWYGEFAETERYQFYGEGKESFGGYPKPHGGYGGFPLHKAWGAPGTGGWQGCGVCGVFCGAVGRRADGTGQCHSFYRGLRHRGQGGGTLYYGQASGQSGAGDGWGGTVCDTCFIRPYGGSQWAGLAVSRGDWGRTGDHHGDGY